MSIAYASAHVVFLHVFILIQNYGLFTSVSSNRPNWLPAFNRPSFSTNLYQLGQFLASLQLVPRSSSCLDWSACGWPLVDRLLVNLADILYLASDLDRSAASRRLVQIQPDVFWPITLHAPCPDPVFLHIPSGGTGYPNTFDMSNRLCTLFPKQVREFEYHTW